MSEPSELNSIIQEIVDARVDMQSFEEFMSAAKEVMISRRLAPDTHSLQHYLAYLDAIKLVFTKNTGSVTVGDKTITALSQQIDDAVDIIIKAGGRVGRATLAAANADKANIAAWSIVEITNDTTLNNGVYLYDGTSFTKSTYDVVAISRSYTDTQVFNLKNNEIKSLQTSVGSTAKSIGLSAVNSVVKAINPYSYFGDRLLNLIDSSMLAFTSADVLVAEAQTGITRIIGSGKMPKVMTDPSKARTITTEVLRDTPSINYIYSSDGALVLTYDNKMVSEIANCDNFLFYHAGRPDFRSTTTGDVFFDTGKIRFRSEVLSSETDKGRLVLEAFNSALNKWELAVLWKFDSVPYNLNATSKGIININGTLAVDTALLIDNKTGTARLTIRGVEYKATESNMSVFTSSATKLISTYVARDTSSNIMISSAFMINARIEEASVISDYLKKGFVSASGGIAGEVPDNSRFSRVVGKGSPIREIQPIPTTLAGSYNIEGVNYLENNYEIVSNVKGNAPDFVIPSAPNVAPWNEPHDRYMIDGSVARLEAMPHPNFPTDKSKVLLMAGAIYYGDTTSTSFYSCAYESSDGGANFTRIAVSNPGSAIPSDSTSTINNIVVSKQAGRYLYVGDKFPDGYKPNPDGLAYKYFFLSETTRRLYGCRDVLNFATYDSIKINKQTVPVLESDGIDSQYKVSGLQAPHYEGILRTPRGVEEKVLGYDSISGRFYRIVKIIQAALDADEPTKRKSDELTTRNLFISWSDKNDITRWNPYNLLIPARKGYYQNYDLDVVHVRDDYWMLLVYRYTVYKDFSDPTQPYFDQHERMSVDLYASYDQLQTAPVLIREDWMTNKNEPWVYGTLNAYGHPFDKNKIYVNGGVGRHAGIQTDVSYRDYVFKVALVNYPFPDFITCDSNIVNGNIVSRIMDGSKVDKVRLITSSPIANILARVLDAKGVVISGMDYFNCAYNRKSGIVSWGGITSLPHERVQIEVQCVNAAFGGIYPMIEVHNNIAIY